MRTALIGFVVPCPHTNLEYANLPLDRISVAIPTETQKRLKQNCEKRLAIDGKIVIVKWDIINNESGVEMLRSHVKMQYRG